MRAVSVVAFMLAAQALAVPSVYQHVKRVEDEENHLIAARQNGGTTTRTTTTTTRVATTSSTTKPPSTTTRPTTTTTTTTRPPTTTTRSTTTTTTAKGSSVVNAELSSRSTTTTTTTRPTSSSATTVKTTTTTRTTTTTTTTTKAAAAATRTLDVTGMTYQNAMMSAHNAHRANHSIAALVWNQDLATTAMHIASSCKYGHNVTADGGGYGQNIGAGAAGNAAAGLVTNLMYNAEIGYYPLPYGNDNPSLDNFHIWGHYSQLVWSDTTDVGCYTQYCPNGLANTGPGVAPYFTVCNYSPPGNYVGEFSSVAAPGGGATLVVVGS